MIKPLIILFTMAFLAMPAMAETLIASKTIRAQSIITPGDITVTDVAVAGAFTDPIQVIGQEARVVLYAGRPIRPGEVGPPALVERNQIVSLLFKQGGLTIATEGRALGRGGIGDLIRVMNLSSRSTVSGTVTPQGTVIVSR
ncbi:flagellar basal body P-ring formation chaperone FlgA [Parasulfitobacter algicola]|uniref:Flagella basal body P-ring formation protein FlgA n=1 Tax=Parasulfitobacter algicola TaxID=2614809 RepID=A0ABX2IWN2_9RHOB|nr:flagellar basal body P-ring formation chaperone FlgA [Sulfitobacter algicola]NSX54673.1 flagellar basal body P-ring formation protein FlgA [Sulfitobacter algicola]